MIEDDFRPGFDSGKERTVGNRYDSIKSIKKRPTGMYNQATEEPKIKEADRWKHSMHDRGP